MDGEGQPSMLDSSPHAQCMLQKPNKIAETPSRAGRGKEVAFVTTMVA